MKLVRDKVPNLIERDGLLAHTHVAKRDELWGLLKEKLVEESLELLQTTELLPENSSEARECPALEELADVLEVIEALQNYVEDSFPGVLAQVKRAKAKSKGRFSKHIVLECTTQPLARAVR